MIRSSRSILAAWHLGILTVILCLFSVVLYKNIASSLNHEIQKHLFSNTEIISDTVFAYIEAEYHSQSHPQTLQKIVRAGKLREVVKGWFKENQNVNEDYVRLLSPEGDVLAASPSNETVQAPLSGRAFSEARKGNMIYETLEKNGARLCLLTRPVIENGKVIYLVQSAAPLDEADHALARLRRKLLFLVPLTLLVTSAVGRFLARTALAPVDRMVKKVQTIGLKDLHERIEVPNTSDEIQLLAVTFNDLLNRLDRSFRRVRQFSAATAHELRTPLSILKGELEVTLRKPRSADEYQGLIQGQLQVLTELANIVEQLLALAYSEEGEEALRTEKIPFGTLIRETMEVWGKVAERKQVSLWFQEDSPLTVWGEKALLGRLIANFLDNAIKHTPVNGRILIKLKKEGQEACLSFQDTGPGIAEKDMPALFDKFFLRGGQGASKEGPGIGLGLGLCRWIAEVHGGRIDAKNNDQGAFFTLRLPVNMNDL